MKKKEAFPEYLVSGIFNVCTTGCVLSILKNTENDKAQKCES
jgi:hypothetical protein